MRSRGMSIHTNSLPPIWRRATLTRGLYSLLETGAYSDLTITCGSDTYKVHKAVVCERLDFFARALRFGGQVSIEYIVQ